jgi:anti-sigma factor RsiW
MTPEQLEFAISQHLDGTLSAEETAALEARLKDDAAARELLEEYRRLNGLLKVAPAAMPAIEWDRLGDHLSSTVAEAAEMEFAISQYADGTLADEQVPAIEAKLAEDAEAQAVLAEHQQIIELVKGAPLPAIRWDRLAEQLSEAVAEANAPRTIKLFANPWVRAVAGLAVAACVAVVSAVMVRGHRGTKPGAPEVAITNANGGTAAVASASKPLDVEIGIGGEPAKPSGVGVSVASAAGSVEISIGAGSDQGGGEAPVYADGIITHSPRSLIATNAATAQDTAQMPY